MIYKKIDFRHRRGSNTRSSLYESDALPLGHCAFCHRKKSAESASHCSHLRLRARKQSIFDLRILSTSSLLSFFTSFAWRSGQVVRRRSRKAKIACSTHVCAWNFQRKIWGRKKQKIKIGNMIWPKKSPLRGLAAFYSELEFIFYANKFMFFSFQNQPGVVACTCNVATYRLNLRTAWVRDHYRSVVYVDQVSMLSLVSTWSSWRNSRCTGFDSEVRTGPGRKRSRQKYPH